MAQPNTSRVLLASASRAESTASLKFSDTEAVSLRFYLDVTDAPGSGGISVVLRGYDKASGNTVDLTTGGVPVTAPGTYAYEISGYAGGDAFGNIIESVGRSVPFQWDAIVKHLDGAAYIYSLSVEVLK